MPWTREGGWTDPWLPLEDTNRNVEDQRADPSSTLTFTRDLIALRRELDDLHRGSYELLETPSGAWAWRRGRETVVAVNLGSDACTIDGVEGHVLISTGRVLDGGDVSGLRLAPREGAIVRGR
jgi:alpha-glucosidase